MQENDITLVDNGTTPIITPADNTPHTEAVQTDAARGFGTKSPIKYAALAGAGIGIGGLTMGFKGDTAAVEPKPDEATSGHLAQTNPPTIHDHTDLATSVSDKMAFGDAFHAAREEQGAGGVFEWHGQYYNTFYKEEWAAMSLEQKTAYAHSIEHLAEPANYHPLPDAVAGDAHPTTEPAHDVATTSLPTEPAHDVVTTALPTEPAHDVVTTALPTEPAIHMPEMPENLVEIPLEDNITGLVHLNGDGQPDIIFIDQDHNHIPELVITPDPNDPSCAHYMLDANQDNVVDEQGVLDSNSQMPSQTGAVTEYDAPTYDNTMDDPSLIADADFDNHADTSEWG